MRIREKLFLLLLPAFLSAVLLMTEFSQKAVQRVVAEQTAKRGLSTLSGYAVDPAVVHAFRLQDETGLLQPLNELLERTGAEYAIAIAPDGRVLAHTNLVEHGKVYRDPTTVSALRQKEPGLRLVVVDKKSLTDVSLPIWDASGSGTAEDFLLFRKGDRAFLGVVRVGLPLEEAYRTSARISREVFFIVALVTGLTLALILFALQRMLSPVPQLVAATKRLAEGSLGTTVPAISRDELGELARSFNRMSCELAETTVSSDFMNSILTNMQDPLIVARQDGTIRLANRSAAELLEVPRDELLGSAVASILPDPNPFFTTTGPGPGLAQLPVQGWDTCLRTRTGREVPVLMSVSALSGQAPDREGFVLAARDITERKRAEAELQHSVSLLQATLDSTADGILVVDAAGKITSFNQKFLDIWTIPPDVLASRDDDRALAHVLDQLVSPNEFLAKVRELYSDPEAESHDTLEFRDGRVVERYSRPQRLGGASCGRVWSFRDITDRKRAEKALRQSEESLRQSQKMEAIGNLAGGVAHDFNNLLTIIFGYSQLLLGSKRESDQEFPALTEIHRAADRAASLTRQLLAFSRRQMLQPKILDLNAAVAEMERMLRRLIGEDVQLVTVQGANLGAVRFDPGQIEQVIMNLVINARDAMAEGGQLTIETANVGGHDVPIDSAERAQALDWVLLAVSDTGCGMDPATQLRIFEPFFTTKGPGKGTGLGLSTVYGIVEQSGGMITVESQLGKGTTFRIYLPQVKETPQGRQTEVPKAEWKGGRETILLVEDEERVRGLIYTVLSGQGYTVLEATNGREAMEIAGRHRDRIQLLLTDVVMPEMGGGVLSQNLTELIPELKVMYMSGYTDDAIVRHGVLDSSAHFLHKPFTVEQLLNGVREVLQSSRIMRAGSGSAGNMGSSA